jgi:hypothetical protein
MTKKLIPLYKSILKAAHLVTDEEGFIKKIRGDTKEPWFIDNLPAVLPLDEQLKQPPGTTTIFHPLFEHLARGESKQVAEYRRALTERLHLTFMAMASELLTIAASQQMHATLTPEQSEFLSFVPEADETMLKKFDALWKAMPDGQNQKAFVSMYLKKGGVLHGKSVHRAAIVSFPLYKQLVEDGEKREAEMEARKKQPKKKDAKADDKLPAVPNETYGVSLRQVDRDSFIKLFQYMVPGIDEADAYSAASNSNIAPSLDAVMHSAERLAGPINDLVERFGDKLSETARIIMRVEDKWVDDFVNLAPLQAEIRMIPFPETAAVQTPEMKKAVEAEARTIVEHVKTPAYLGQAAEQAPAASESAPVEEKHAPAGFSLPPKTIPPTAQPAHVPQQQPQMPYPGAAYPGAPYPQPGYPHAYAGAPDPRMMPPGAMPPAQQPPAGPIPNTGRGADFHELMRRNPALAAAAVGAPGSYPTPGMVPYGYPPMQRDEPTFVTQQYGTQRSVYQQPGYPQQQQGYPQQQTYQSYPPGYVPPGYQTKF